MQYLVVARLTLVIMMIIKRFHAYKSLHYDLLLGRIDKIK